MMEREKMIEEMVKIIKKTYEKHGVFNPKWFAEAICDKFFSYGAVVLTKEELVKAVEEGYIYDTTKGNKINLIEMARDVERKEVVKEICDFAESEIKRLGKETVTDSFGERPLLFYEAAGILVRGIKNKFGGRND